METMCEGTCNNVTSLQRACFLMTRTPSIPTFLYRVSYSLVPGPLRGKLKGEEGLVYSLHAYTPCCPVTFPQKCKGRQRRARKSFTYQVHEDQTWGAKGMHTKGEPSRGI